MAHDRARTPRGPANAGDQGAGTGLGPFVSASDLLAVHGDVLAQTSVESALACVVRSACELTGAADGSATVFGADGLIELLVPGEFVGDQVASADIMLRDEVLGVLQISATAAGDRDRSGAILQFLAATAALVIENFRLAADTERSDTWVRASTEITRTLLRRGNDHTLRDIARRLRELVDADVVKVVLQVEGQERMRVEVALVPDDEDGGGEEYPSLGTLSRAIIETGEPVRLADADQVAGLEVHVDDTVRVGQVLGLPLIVAGRPRGALLVGRLIGRRVFTLAELDMGSAFAGQAALALELVDTREAQDRIAQWEDRSRIARDLHDVVIQQLFAAGLTIRGVITPAVDPALSPVLEHVVGELDDAIAQIRTSIFALQHQGAGTRSVVLDTAASLADTLGRAPSVRFFGPVDTLTPLSLRQDIRAVLGEALTNVARHALAHRVDVRVGVRDGWFRIEVVDDGVGTGGATRDSGLANLRSRAGALGGRMELDSSATAGTSLLWTVPLDT